MEILTSRFKEYLLKSRINLLEKKTQNLICFFMMTDGQSKLHTGFADGNIAKKFQPSIFYRSRENRVFPKTFRTDGHFKL